MVMYKIQAISVRITPIKPAIFSVPSPFLIREAESMTETTAQARPAHHTLATNKRKLQPAVAKATIGLIIIF